MYILISFQNGFNCHFCTYISNGDQSDIYFFPDNGEQNNFHLLDLVPCPELVVVDSLHSLSCTLEGNDILFVTFITQHVDLSLVFYLSTSTTLVHCQS